MTKYIFVYPNGEERPLQFIRLTEDRVYLKDPDMSFKPEPYSFIKTGVDGFDHTLGGGLVAGKLVYFCGIPGVGVTTLLVQVAGSFANADRKALFVSSEPVADIVRLGQRVGVENKNVEVRGDVQSKDLHEINTIGAMTVKPKLVIVNVVEDLSEREIEELKNFARRTGTCVILTGYLDKVGNIRDQEASHYADVLLVLAWTRASDKDAPKADDYDIRLLTTEKNRLGKENVKTYWRMTPEGLKRVGRG